jgi:hypothetical protein
MLIIKSYNLGKLEKISLLSKYKTKFNEKSIYVNHACLCFLLKISFFEMKTIYEEFLIDYNYNYLLRLPII